MNDCANNEKLNDKYADLNPNCPSSVKSTCNAEFVKKHVTSTLDSYRKACHKYYKNQTGGGSGVASEFATWD